LISDSKEPTEPVPGDGGGVFVPGDGGGVFVPGECAGGTEAFVPGGRLGAPANVIGETGGVFVPGTGGAGGVGFFPKMPEAFNLRLEREALA
jgi:hypothetical protein